VDALSVCRGDAASCPTTTLHPYLPTTRASSAGAHGHTGCMRRKQVVDAGVMILAAAFPYIYPPSILPILPHMPLPALHPGRPEPCLP
jgi:hypothetical protein